MHQENAADRHYSESAAMPNGSYQMPSPMCHYHIQQNNQLQQSAIFQDQLYHNHEQLQSTLWQSELALWLSPTKYPFTTVSDVSTSETIRHTKHL